jgi:hypothetical protein
MRRGNLLLLLSVAVAAGAFGYLARSATEPVPDLGPGRPTTVRPERDAAIPPPLSGPDPARELFDLTSGTLSGTGRITGRVTTPTGDPIAGVLVRSEPELSYPRDGREGLGPPGGRDPRARRDAEIADLRDRLGSRREARTDTDGSFTIEGLPEDGRFRLTAWRRGYSIEAGRRGRSRYPGDHVVLFARKLVLVPVQVVGPDDRPVERAHIWMEGAAHADTRSWSPGEPEVGFPPGRWRVRAVAGEHLELASEEMDLTIDLAKPPESIRLHLAPRSGIRGRVRFPEDPQITSVEVSAVRLRDGTPPAPELLENTGLSEDVDPWWTRTFSFLDLAPGRYLVGLRAGRGPFVACETVEVGREVVVLDLTLPPPGSDALIEVRVEGPDGAPLTEVSFLRGYEYGSQTVSRNGLPTPTAPGRFRMATLPQYRFHPMPASCHWIQVTSNLYGSKRVHYQAGKMGDFTVRFEAPATLEVSLEPYRNTSLEGAIDLKLVGIATSESGPVTRVEYRFGGRVNPEGRRRYGPLQPGRYEIEVEDTGGDRDRHIATVNLTLVAGMNRKTIELPSLHSLTVLVPGEEGADVMLMPFGGAGRFSVRAKVEDGRVVFDRLGPGDYQVYVSTLHKRIEVTVPASGPVRFEPRSPNMLRVSIRDATGYLAKAGFEDGDIVVRVDEIEFEHPVRILMYLQACQSKKETVLTVRRGDAVHHIAVAPGRLPPHKSAGGQFDMLHR